MSRRPILASAAPVEPEYNARILNFRDRSAIAGSAAVIGDPLAGPAGKAPSRRAEANEVWGHYGQVGELWHAEDYLGNCFARIRLRVGFLDDEGKPRPILDDDDPEMVSYAEMAGDLIRDLKAPSGGQPQLLRSMGKLWSLVGEFYLLGSDVVTPDGQIVDATWEALSTDELRPSSDGRGYTRTRAPGQTPEPLSDVYPVRIWNPHPRYSSLADSAIFAQLENLEVIVLLRRKVRAEVISRLVQAGVYWVPEEMSFAPDPSAPAGEEGDDPFTRDIIETAAAAISDRGSAASALPMVARAAADLIKSVRLDTFPVPDDATSILKRQEAVQSFAQGVDLSVETTVGHQSTTFANAEKITETDFRIYVEPKLGLILDGVTGGFLHPAMKALVGLEQWMPMPEMMARVVIWYDESDLVLSPDMEKIAPEAHDRFLISDASARRLLGLNEDDAPDPAERARRIREKQLLNVKETIRADETGAGGVSLLDPNLQSPANQPGAPDTGPQVVGSASGDPGLFQRQCAVSVVVFAEKAADTAGARLKSRLNGKPEWQSAKTLPNDRVAAALGRQACEQLFGSIDQLLAGQFDPLRRMVLKWAVDAGVADPDTVADAIVGVADQVTRDRLFNPGSAGPSDAVWQVANGVPR